MVEIILSLIGGLVLFLFAVTTLSEVLKSVIGPKAQAIIEKNTSNIFTCILIGIILTALLDSSSAVIIITIVLINTNILTFKKGMGIVLGANIGTTISSQIIAMNISKYSPVFLLIGFLLVLIAKSERVTKVGKVILYFGILFFGLLTMENAVEPLKKETFFVDWMKKTEQPITGALIGAMVTLIIQSSSATVGIAIILAKKGFLSLAGGVAVMLGAELGTCSDTLLATIRGTRQALKTGLFHLSFNLISIIIGLTFFYPFISLVKYVSSKTTIERAVANAHVLFNVIGVLIFIWTIPLFEKFLNKLLPDK